MGPFGLSAMCPGLLVILQHDLTSPTSNLIAYLSLAPLVVLQFAFPVLGQVIVTGAEATDTWVPATPVLPSCRVNKPDGVTLAPGTRAGKTREHPPSPT
ncbi:hypothetical protein CPAR01_08918 [Colletotrichum paranaense]|uniref:Uncharacterized protein n=1 Tax=Colletotrichum paranaense TaxID=1914294 RepID=A0ABQ9SF93_9PEZI|nr:uncharacterized protein CPAR01_08918 [Colletotrichum paranaense]KAK1535376.1 hypothetical protein CPAR01_08918 [Colletotrichum paranaense]